MAGLRTEYPFALPKGYVDAEGRVHQDGVMRLATARDELEPLGDPKVRDAEDPYLSVIVLSRVITRLGGHTRLSPRDVDGLFAADLAHLQDVYGIINYGTQAEIDRYLTQFEQSRAQPGPPDPAPASGTSPVSDAARSLLEPASHRADGTSPDEDPTSGPDEELTEPTRPPRRSRIEEVGRSSGRPS